MVKKRKAKRVKAKKVKRAKLMARKAKAVPKPSMAQSYTLCLAGSIIVLIAGIIALVFSKIFTLIPLVGTFVTLAALPNLVCGIVMLIATATIRKNPKSAGIIILLFSIIAIIFPPYGFIVGPILSLIGSIILLVKR